MAKKKFYAVRKGLVPGIYNTWGDCQANVNGFPGAEYKSFTNEQEAKEFMGIENDKDRVEDSVERVYSESEAIAYVDGSYDLTKNQYSYGVVIFFDGQEERLAEKFSDVDMASMRNVAGEIEGSKRVMRFCIENNIKSIDIVYDYEGIEKWCTGAWRTNKTATKEYKRFYNDCKKNVDIKFVKVKSHSGNKYNDLADQLAKNALGIGNGEKISVNTNGVVANNIKYDDLISIIELLKDDFKDLNYSEVQEIPYGKQLEISIQNPNLQKIKILYFDDKNKVSIQGRKEDLFNQLSLYIVELLEVDKIPEFLNTVHNLNVDKDLVENDFIKYFPNSYNKLPKDLSNYLHQAVYNLHIMGNMYITNFLVEPAIRSLEAILKIALLDNNIPIKKEDSDSDSFFVFKRKHKMSDTYVLRDEYIMPEHSHKLLHYLSKCCTYFKLNRNTLVHWDNPKDTPDTTRILNSVEEAHTIIKDAINLMDEYYTI